MFLFEVTLKHDSGQVKLLVRESNINDAVIQALDSEKAPERAIINIKRIKEIKPWSTIITMSRAPILAWPKPLKRPIMQPAYGAVSLAAPLNFTL